MKPIRFIEIKNNLLKAIEEKLKVNPIPNENGFTIIEGFITTSLQSEISGNFILGGPSIPTVAIVGNTSGRIYTFALKILMPDLWKED